MVMVMMLSMLHLTDQAKKKKKKRESEREGGREKIIAWKFDAGIVHAIGASAFPHFSAPCKRGWRGRDGGGSDRGGEGDEEERGERNRCVTGGSIRCGQAA